MTSLPTSMMIIAVLATPMAWSAPSADDEAMLKLATGSGCMTCHHIDPGAQGPDGLPPIGPAWRAVAAKYRGSPDAADRLMYTVMNGSSPYASHWKGKVSGLAMPPNAVAIKEPDARLLVDWILKLDDPK